MADNCNSWLDCSDLKGNLTGEQIFRQLITKDGNGCASLRIGVGNNKRTKTRGLVKNIADTASHDVIAASTTQKINVTQLIVTNGSATVGTLVDILDDVTVIYSGYAGAGNGFVLNFPSDNPLELSAAKKLAVKCFTTGADVTVSANGYLD